MKTGILKKTLIKIFKKIQEKAVRKNPQNYQIKKLQKLKEKEDHIEITVNPKR